MPRLLLFLGVFFLLGCRKSKPDYTLPDRKDIDAIIKIVVKQDSLFTSRKYKPLSVDLQKIKIYKRDETEQKRLSHNLNDYDVDIADIITPKIDGQQFFADGDTAYLVFQNDVIAHYQIDSKMLSQFNTTTLQEQKRKVEMHDKQLCFTAISNPVFSLNRKRAYLVINEFCGMNGGGQAIFLEKVAGRWEIVKRLYTWVS